MTIPRSKASSKLLQENDRVIVTEWRFAPGAETEWHRHAHDYVVVCLTAGSCAARSAQRIAPCTARYDRGVSRQEGDMP